MNKNVRKKWKHYMTGIVMLLCSFVLLSGEAYSAVTVPANVDSFKSSTLKVPQYWKASISGKKITVELNDSKAADGTRTLLRIDDRHCDWESISSGTSKMTVDVSDLPNGKYSLVLFEARNKNSNEVWSLSEYQIKVKKGKPAFVFTGGKSEKKFYKYLSRINPKDYDGLPYYAYQMKNLNKVVSVTKKLIKKCKNKKEKVKAIHDWIAKKIAYDYESYLSGNTYSAADPDMVITKRRGVCSGYSRLARVMFSVAKIPCLNIYGYANGKLKSGVDYSVANHEWNAVYIKDRWYLMDITWDSLNQYYGAWSGKNVTGQKAKYTYYGISPELLSTNHCSLGIFNFSEVKY